MTIREEMNRVELSADVVRSAKADLTDAAVALGVVDTTRFNPRAVGFEWAIDKALVSLGASRDILDPTDQAEYATELSDTERPEYELGHKMGVALGKVLKAGRRLGGQNE